MVTLISARQSSVKQQEQETSWIRRGSHLKIWQLFETQGNFPPKMVENFNANETQSFGDTISRSKSVLCSVSDQVVSQLLARFEDIRCSVQV